MLLNHQQQITQYLIIGYQYAYSSGAENIPYDEHLPQRSKESMKSHRENWKKFMIPIERQIPHPASR